MAYEWNDDDNADLSVQCAAARRDMRRRLLQIGDQELMDAYTRAVVLSEHEAARRGVNRIIERSHLSNKAEA